MPYRDPDLWKPYLLITIAFFTGLTLEDFENGASILNIIARYLTGLALIIGASIAIYKHVQSLRKDGQGKN